MKVSLKVLLAALRCTLLCVVTLTMFAGQYAGAQAFDPGIRGGPPGGGQPFSTGLSSGESAFFFDPGLSQFTQVEAVADGLGPRFNLDSCAGCHIFPDVGGSSPPTGNPQVVRQPIMAPGNTVPSFLTDPGPIREVRFIKNPDQTPDGGVHSIFTIAGRSDKPFGCAIGQPNFSNTSNMLFRIPTPTFGAGLIET